MSTTIVPFDFRGDQVRVVTIDGEPWLVARDVAAALGYADLTNAVKLHSRGVAVHHPILDSLGRTQNARVISEPDVLRMIVSSRLPAAVEFERWVFEEVLPQARRQELAPPELPTNFLEALKALVVSEEQKQALEVRVSEDAPKVEAFAQFINSDGDFTLEAAAKALGTGRTRLTNFMRAEGIMMQHSTTPKQPHVNQGHFRVVTRTHERVQNGRPCTVSYDVTLVTPKGLEYLRKRLARAGELVAVTA